MIALLVAACVRPDDEPAPACPEAGLPHTIAEGFADGTEGVAIGDGTVYVTARDGWVHTVDEAGATPLVAVPDPVGATYWRGALWVASWNDETGADAPAIVEITPSGEAVRHATPTIARPNFLAPTPWGTLLVADDFVDVISEWRGEGDVIAWSTGVPSPNGLAITEDGTALYAASTFRDQGLWRVTLDGEAAGAVEKLVDFLPTDAPDGLALGDDGSVYVALNLADTVVRWHDGEVTPVATLDTPASLAFDADACTVVATSLFGEVVSRFDAPTKGVRPTWAD